jgi:hypothetical protein
MFYKTYRSGSRENGYWFQKETFVANRILNELAMNSAPPSACHFRAKWDWIIFTWLGQPHDVQFKVFAKVVLFIPVSWCSESFIAYDCSGCLSQARVQFHWFIIFSRDLCRSHLPYVIPSLLADLCDELEEHSKVLPRREHTPTFTHIYIPPSDFTFKQRRNDTQSQRIHQLRNVSR